MREFCLVPLPGVTFPEQIRSLVTVYQEMGKVLTAKSGVSSLLKIFFFFSMIVYANAMDT